MGTFIFLQCIYKLFNTLWFIEITLLLIDIRDLRCVMMALPDCIPWKHLGLELGIDYTTLQVIGKENRGSPSHCLIEMLAAWLYEKDDVVHVGKPSWEQLVQALRNINEQKAAEKIKEEYLNNDSTLDDNQSQ